MLLVVLVLILILADAVISRAADEARLPLLQLK
jgi:hypothetical protein